MKSVYVFGPIHIFGQDYLPLYKKLMALCKKYFDNVIGTYPDFWATKENPAKFYNRTAKTIKKCELFIAEVSSPSHGVGMELQMAAENKIPVILIAKKGLKISIMVTGLPNIKKIIRYKNTDELLKKMESELKKTEKKRK